MIYLGYRILLIGSSYVSITTYLLFSCLIVRSSTCNSKHSNNCPSLLLFPSLLSSVNIVNMHIKYYGWWPTHLSNTSICGNILFSCHSLNKCVRYFHAVFDSMFLVRQSKAFSKLTNSRCIFKLNSLLFSTIMYQQFLHWFSVDSLWQIASGLP